MSAHFAHALGLRKPDFRAGDGVGAAKSIATLEVFEGASNLEELDLAFNQLTEVGLISRVGRQERQNEIQSWRQDGRRMSQALKQNPARQSMLPQYIITLGARSPVRKESGGVGHFDENDYRTIEKIVRDEHGFQGCTVIRAKGFYQGEEEDTVQIILLEENYQKVRECAQQLRVTFRQRSVMVVSAGVGEFLT